MSDFDAESDLKEVGMLLQVSPLNSVLNKSHEEYTLQRLYLQGKYSQVLRICDIVLDAVEEADGPNNRTSSHSRELLDTALRCAIKLNDKEKILLYAERSRDYVRTSLLLTLRQT